MKTNFYRAVTAVIFGVVLCTSCIYEFRDDPYYRTLWVNSDTELGAVTVDFLCDNVMAVKAENGLFDDYGTYSTDGKTAFFDDLVVIQQEGTLVLVDAVRSGDSLELTWHAENETETKTVVFKRLSSYDQVPACLQ